MAIPSKAITQALTKTTRAPETLEKTDDRMLKALTTTLNTLQAMPQNTEVKFAAEKEQLAREQQRLRHEESSYVPTADLQWTEWDTSYECRQHVAKQLKLATDKLNEHQQRRLKQLQDNMIHILQTSNQLRFYHLKISLVNFPAPVCQIMADYAVELGVNNAEKTKKADPNETKIMRRGMS